MSGRRIELSSSSTHVFNKSRLAAAYNGVRTHFQKCSPYATAYKVNCFTVISVQLLSLCCIFESDPALHQQNFLSL